MQRDTSAATRILLAEDSDRDAELVLHELKRAGVRFESRHVQTEADFRRALDEFRPQLILSDYVMPGFSGIAALTICREAGIDIPFIFVSGTIGEDVAVASMKAGADDYVMKTNLIRLGPTVVRALREAGLRQGGRVTEAALLRAQTMAKLAHVIAGPDGSFESWSDTLPQMIGLDPAAMPRSTREWLNLVHPDDRASLRAKAIEAARTGVRIEFEYRLRRADGSWLNISQTSEALLGTSIAPGKQRWFSTLQDVTEQKHVEEDLRRFRLALDNSADIIFIVDRATMRHVDANHGACRLLGYTRQELLQMGPQDLLPVSLLELETTYDALIADPSQSSGMQSHYRCKDGSLLPFESTRHVIRSGDSWLITVVSRDIRGRLAAAEKQRSMTQLLDNIVENIPTAVHLKSVADGLRIKMWNKAAEQMSGVQRQEAIGKNVHDLWPRALADRFHAADLELIADGRTQDFPDRVAQTRDRGEIRVHMRKVALFDGAGKVTHLLVIADDITAQLADHERLRESEARFRSLSQLSSDWFWQQDEEFRFVEFTGGDTPQGWGPDQKNALGLRRWELPGVTPVSGVWDEHKAQHEAHLPYRNFEYQHKRVDGTTKYISASGEPVFDAGGHFTGYRGVATEITKRKQAEWELQRFGKAMDISPDSIYLTDPATMRFVYLNRTACQRLGHPREELLQKGPQDVLPIGREEIAREYGDVIAAGETGLIYERPFTRSDGSSGWTELHRRALATDGGSLIVTIGRDITERKDAENRLKRLNRVHAMLSGINSLIVRVRDPGELFREACRIAVEAGNFSAAWIGLLDRPTMEIVPVASQGMSASHMDAVRDSLGKARSRGDSIAGDAIHQKRPVISNDIANDQRAQVARQTLSLGTRALAVLPFVSAGEVVGMLSLHARETGFFDADEMELLQDLAGNIAFAIDHLDKADRLEIEAAERKRAETRVVRLNRVHAMLSGINSAIVRVQSREALFTEACRVAVENGKFRMAWIGIVDKAAMRVNPAAWRGVEDEYIAKIPVALDDTGPHGRGLAGRTVRECMPIVVEDMTDDPRITLKEEAHQRGFRSLVMLPLMVEGEAVGLLALYASEVGFFDGEEMKLLGELAGDIAFALDHIEKKERLDYLAYYDSLTGLANRTLFHERLSQHLSAAQSAGGKLAVVVADIERFRMVNDSLGRQAGDALLKQVAERFARNVERSDIARIGSDQFAIALPEMKGRSEIGRTVEELWRSCLDEPFRLGDTEIRVALKGGIALYPSDGTDADALFRTAEAAWKKAKQTGERYLFHAPEMTARVAEKLTLENKLRQALEREEFVLHYQPKVDLDRRDIVGVEALIRWQSPERGLVPPGLFIPVLEETGLILQAGEWAMKRATLDHERWLREGVAAPRIAVNVSAIQLRQRDFVDVVRRATAGGAAPTAVDVEITESLLMEDVAGTIEKLKALRELGMKLSIDDFGTGYSSLGYLAKLPVHTLKIDRSFIIAMLNDADTMTLVSTIISLAHSLRLTVVAEGVEQEDQAKMLRLLRCDQMQGYLISKPLPFEQVTPLLRGKS